MEIMGRSKLGALLYIVMAFALIAAACGDDGASEPASSTGGSGADSTETPGDVDDGSAREPDEAGSGADGNVVDLEESAADSDQDTTGAALETVTLTARCKAAPPQEDGRCNNLAAAVDSANVELEAAGDNRRIALETIQDDLGWGEYKTEFELASEAGQAPDIVASSHVHIGDWVPAGYLADIATLIDRHPQLDDVIETLWGAVEFKGQRWGVPQDAEARPIFYSKILLAELGWSEDQIEGLDERINSGEFSFQDMLATAREAIDAGVVAEDFGWWHRPVNGPDFLYYYYAGGGGELSEGDNITFDRGAALNVYRLFETATQELNVTPDDKLDGNWDLFKEVTADFTKVLFVSDGTWRWAGWATNYLQDVGGESYLVDNVGHALIPANADGSGEPITLTQPIAYMVSSQSDHPDLAVRLIANATTSELNTPYAVDSGHLGILNAQSEDPAYLEAEFLSETLYMLDHTNFQPNNQFYSTWSEIFFSGVQAVENGELSAEDAVAYVVGQLEAQLGDNVIISE